MNIYLGGAFFALLILGGICFMVTQVRGKYASSVHIIWYLFSLSFCAAFIGLRWARAVGAMDAMGNPGNETGKWVVATMNFSMDLQADFYVLSALVLLVVGPQCLSYVLSGLFGCASRPRFVSFWVSVFTWGMAKSFAITAGVLLVVDSFGSGQGWHGFDAKFAIKYACLALILLLFAFASLLGQASVDEIPILANGRHFGPLRMLLARIDQWMVRHRSDEAGLNEHSTGSQSTGRKRIVSGAI
ncbi:hypothetical protein [Dyella kyungheensis]|uniref:Uncharacterized protein n=1 Tax=Dyella kyungheensis TaxID=1242174 RepID=A0ABS2JRD1_9GAMM|nr:hypothetical protein [Dyella kyungheensis]MBM7121370.1 hypothetical protein [Dyella kyungheensis]